MLNLCISFLERLLSPSRWMQLNGEIHQSCFLISDLHQVTSLDRAASGSSIRKSPSVLLDRRLLSSESGHLVLAAVFTSSMPRSNCPQMFSNAAYLEQETAKCWSRLRWRFIFWCDFQHNILTRVATLIGHLYRMYTQILMFKNTTAQNSWKLIFFSGYIVWKGKQEL